MLLMWLLGRTLGLVLTCSPTMADGVWLGAGEGVDRREFDGEDHGACLVGLVGSAVLSQGVTAGQGVGGGVFGWTVVIALLYGS